MEKYLTVRIDVELGGDYDSCEVESISGEIINEKSTFQFVQDALSQLSSYELQQLIKLPNLQQEIAKENKINISAANSIKENLRLFPRFLVVNERSSWQSKHTRLDFDNIDYTQMDLGLKTHTLYQEVDLQSLKEISPKLYEHVKKNIKKQKELDVVIAKRNETRKLNRKKNLEKKAKNLLDKASKLE